MRQTRHLTLYAIPLLAVGACLLWASPASAEECASPCTVTHSIVPQLRLNDSTSGATDWIVRASANGAQFQVGPSGAPLTFRIEDGDGLTDNLLFLDASHLVGINTTVPQRLLQINSTRPAIRLDDISSGAGHVDLLVSGSLFEVVGAGGQGVLQISTDAPPQSLRINPNGRVGLGVATPEATLHVDGDARIEGDVALGSSRTLKTAFSPVSSSEILARVADLPVASWRYKSESEAARHVGPFAEDFQRLFGLGDGETISIVDAQGVAFAAIQGLEQRLAEKEAKLEQLRSEKDAQIAELTARLAAIEERMMPRDDEVEHGAHRAALGCGPADAWGRSSSITRSAERDLDRRGPS